MSRTYDLRVIDSAIEESREKNGRTSNLGVYHVRRRKDRDLYKVKIFLEGNDLPYVSAVTYRLPPTFGNPRARTVRRLPSNPNCSLTIWTWGVFGVHVRIEMKSGQIITVNYELAYDKAFEFWNKTGTSKLEQDGSFDYEVRKIQESALPA